MRPESEAALSPLHQVSADDIPRLPIPCWPEVENMLNGGLVVGTVLALYGPPGIGKSTLVLQLADAMATMGPSAYLTTEQLVPQVKLTAVRVGVADSGVLVGYHTRVEEVERVMAETALRFIAVDSLQGCCLRGEEPEAAMRLVQAARRHAVAMVLVLHATKDGDYSGPRVVEHQVDGMVSFDDDATLGPHLTVVDKYRYGPIGRIAKLGRSDTGRLWDGGYGPRHDAGARA
jgi:DNA repair protein RadA/Sms